MTMTVILMAVRRMMQRDTAAEYRAWSDRAGARRHGAMPPLSTVEAESLAFGGRCEAALLARWLHGPLSDLVAERVHGAIRLPQVIVTVNIGIESVEAGDDGIGIGGIFVDEELVGPIKPWFERRSLIGFADGEPENGVCVLGQVQYVNQAVDVVQHGPQYHTAKPQ